MTMLINDFNANDLKWEQLFDKTPRFGEVGFGITIGQNAFRALEKIDPYLEKQLYSLSVPNVGVVFRDVDCNIGFRQPETVSLDYEKYGKRNINDKEKLDPSHYLIFFFTFRPCKICPSLSIRSSTCSSHSAPTSELHSHICTCRIIFSIRKRRKGTIFHVTRWTIENLT